MAYQRLPFLCLLLSCLCFAGAAGRQASSIDQWIAQLGADDDAQRQQARAALIEGGQEAVPALLSAIEKGDPRRAEALAVLGGTGPVARDVAPRLQEIAAQQNWPPDVWIPFYRAIAENENEEARIRGMAIEELGRTGKAAIPTLRRLLDAETESVSDWARHALGAMIEKADGPEAKARFFAQLVEEDPFHPDVLERLSTITGYVNSGRPHPMREKVKALYRARLQEKPDPALARMLALLVQDQLRNTEIRWETHTDSVMGHSTREAPGESLATLAEILDYGLRHAEKGADLWREFGIGLARLRLLQGDWDGMNKMLTALGQTPIAEKDRPFLAAPPEDWTGDVGKRWGPADPAMRSGDAALVMRFEKSEGRGAAGVHVLLQPAPKPEDSRFGGRLGGWREPPLGSARPFSDDTFGYGNEGDRAMTRYAVSGASGEVRFEKLPAGPLKMMILMPTASFPETARDWDVWVETAPGQFERAALQPPLPDAPGPRNPAYHLDLKPGETKRYPTLVVRPQYDLNVEDGARVDPNDLVLTWDASPLPAGKAIQYELEMRLTHSKGLDDRADRMPVVRSGKVTTRETRWPAAKEGVGGVRLAPGNQYVLQVNARDEAGTVIAGWGPIRVWAQWVHRETRPPIRSDHELPLMDDLYFRVSHGRGDVEENFPQWCDRWLSENPEAFEREYVQVVRAWLAWHDKQVPDARRQLLDLIRALPKGNLAQSTAIWLLGEIDAQASPPKRLKFIAFEDLDPARVAAMESVEAGQAVPFDYGPPLDLRILAQKRFGRATGLFDALSKTPASNVSAVEINADVLGRAGEKYSRFELRDSGGSRMPEPPRFRILDEKGTTITAGQLDYG